MGSTKDKETKLIEQNFMKWLALSSISMTDFLSYRTVPGFKVESGTEPVGEYRIVKLIYQSKNGMKQIGEQLAYPIGNLEAFQDVALLLLYIASQWDRANEKAPMFEQRKNYFYHCVKSYIEHAEEYIMMQK